MPVAAPAALTQAPKLLPSAQVHDPAVAAAAPKTPVFDVKANYVLVQSPPVDNEYGPAAQAVHDVDVEHKAQFNVEPHPVQAPAARKFPGKQTVQAEAVVH